MINVKKVSLIKEFRKFLDDFCYDIINIFMNGELNYFFNPWQHYNVMKVNLMSLDYKRRNVYNLLLLGEQVTVDDAIYSIGSRMVDILLEIGLISEKNGYVCTDGYAVVSYFDHYFVVGINFHYPTTVEKDPAVYIAQDTYRLSRLLPLGKVEKSLDLCTGSGIQAVLQARNSNKVIGVEYNPKAAPYTRFNVILNNLEDKVEVREGDLYEPVKDEKFDIITTNPPFIPVPVGIDFSIAGDGGEDGLLIVRRIIDGYNMHLNMGGYGIMIGEAIGDEKGPFIIKVLEELLGDRFNTKLILDQRMPIESQTKIVSKVGAGLKDKYAGKESELERAWADMYKRLSATYYYTFTIKAKKLPDHSGKLDVIALYNKWTMDNKPSVTQDYELEASANNTNWVKVGSDYIANVDEEALELLQLCNGNYSVEEITKQIYDKFGDKNENIDLTKEIYNTLTVCNNLEIKGLLKKN